jgi:transposase
VKSPAGQVNIDLAAYGVLVGMDWASEKHDVAWCRSDSTDVHLEQIAHTPEDLEAWVRQLRERAGGRKVLVSLEQRRGALIYILMKYDFVVIAPLDPARLSAYRDAVRSTSGAKDDPSDAGLILDYLRKHPERLRIWEPDDEATREIAALSQQRREAVDERKRLGNRLHATLQESFPQALSLSVGDLVSPAALEFLTLWPGLEALQSAGEETVVAYYRRHRQSQETITQRIEAIASAVPATTDGALVRTAGLRVSLICEQLQVLNEHVRQLDCRLRALVQEHPDAEIFADVPGLGEALTPRVIAAFGTNRDKFAAATDLQSFSGIGPVTESSGKRRVVKRRLACPKFVLQTFHEFANTSRQFSTWARAYYAMKKAAGMQHHTILRNLAYKWLRILFRCWKDRVPYNEHRYILQLYRRKSPITEYLATNT